MRTWLSAAAPNELTPGFSQSSAMSVSQPSGAEISFSRCARHASTFSRHAVSGPEFWDAWPPAVLAACPKPFGDCIQARNTITAATHFLIDESSRAVPFLLIMPLPGRLLSPDIRRYVDRFRPARFASLIKLRRFVGALAAEEPSSGTTD